MEKYYPVFAEVIESLPKSFDAHDLILALLKKDPITYFAILREAEERVFQANANISNHLKNNGSVYGIHYVGKTVSPDIYQIDNDCAEFEK